MLTCPAGTNRTGASELEFTFTLRYVMLRYVLTHMFYPGHTLIIFIIFCFIIIIIFISFILTYNFILCIIYHTD
jgi:hypothetical protein